MTQFFRQQVVQVDIGAMCRTTPGRLRNDAGDHAHRGRSGDPVDVDVIGLPCPRHAAQPKPLGIDGQILREGAPIAVAEQDGQGAESAAGPQEDLLQGALHYVPTEQRSCQATLLQFGRVLVHELIRRRAGHDPHVASPPQQFLDFGNQERFARAIGQGRGNVEDLRGPLFTTAGLCRASSARSPAARVVIAIVATWPASWLPSRRFRIFLPVDRLFHSLRKLYANLAFGMVSCLTRDFAFVNRRRRPNWAFLTASRRTSSVIKFSSWRLR